MPGKNVKPLGGRPLLEWTARTIRAAEIEGRAVLSTDDEGIARVGRAAGLATPFMRPPALAADTTDMVAVVEHAVQWFEVEEGWRATAVLLLQPTSPFRRPERLRQALELLAHPGTEAVVGVTALHRPPSLLYREDADGWLASLAPWDAGTIRQQVPPTLTPNGTLYLTTTESLRHHRRLFPPRMRPLATTAIEAIDIDTPEDWALAEAVVAAGLAHP